jgi:hypothetical protein
LKETLIKSANDAFEIGYLGKIQPDLSGLYDLKILNEVLKEKGLQEILDPENQTAPSSNNSSGTTIPTMTGNSR